MKHPHGSTDPLLAQKNLKKSFLFISFIFDSGKILFIGVHGRLNDSFGGSTVFVNYIFYTMKKLYLVGHLRSYLPKTKDPLQSHDFYSVFTQKNTGLNVGYNFSQD